MLEKLWEIVYAQKDIIVDNWVLFLTYGVLCIGVTITSMAFVNKHYNKIKKLEYEEACRDVKILKKDNDDLKKENFALKKIYEEYDLLPKLRSGANNNPPATSAELISDAMRKYAK